MAEVKRQADIGPRQAALPNLNRRGKHIMACWNRSGGKSSAGIHDQTPRGPIKFVNIVARFSADGVASRSARIRNGRFSVRTTIPSVSRRYASSGANDGASSTGALLELARVLSARSALAAKIELVFFDGEEAVRAIH
jgi:Zn-dependent M28 family amino/carboxypeptidase